MNVSAWSIRHPVPAILLFVLLCFFGLLGLKKLGIQNFPDIELPIVTITASLEGAAPGQLETEVARKIEDSVTSIGNVRHIYTIITDGVATVMVEFEIEKNGEEALNEVRNAVDSVRSDLPAEMTAPVISKMTTTGMPILTYTVASGTMNEQELSWFVDNDITKAMLAVRGVGKVQRIGGVQREVHIDLDPALMAGLKVTAQDVSDVLKRVQRDASGGRGDIGGGMQSVRTLGAVGTVQQIAALEIPLADGRHVRLDDVAKVSDTIAERSAYALLDGKPVVGFDITRSKGMSEVSVAGDVQAAVTRLSAQYPQVTIAEAFNMVSNVEDNYRGSMYLLYEGAALATLVVLLFLRHWRATLVASSALPLSVIPTFAFMYFAGFSLNVITLLSLALVVGILVDDAIVEIENIVRHLRMGKTPYQAAMEAADEIGMAVIATSFTLIAVFLPTAFMGGIPGKFFRQFGLTAAVAVLSSLAVARLLTPMMASYLLKPEEHGTPADGPVMRRYMGWARWCLAHRKTTVAAATAFFAGSLLLVPLLPSAFMPAADISMTRVSLELQPGSTIDDTYATSEEARKLVMQVPDVKQVFTVVGSSAGLDMFGTGAASDVRRATLTLSLTHRTQRSLKQFEVEKQIRERLGSLPGVRTTIGMGDNGEKLQLILVGDDTVALQQAGAQLERELRTLPDIGNITSVASLQRPEVQITPDFARAADLGVTAMALSNVIRVATYGDFETTLPKLNLPQRQIPIRARLDDSVRRDLSTLAELRVPARSGGSVPLSAVADIRLGDGPAQIDRIDRVRKVEIDVELEGRPTGEVMAQVNQLSIMQNLPPGVRKLPLGDVEMMQDLFSSFGVAMLIGILCIYVVLVLLFHDFLQPATILAALPLSVGGAFIALLLTHSSFSMPSIIGLLMLMGVVTKNSILLVEYAVMARREHGLGRFEALMDACHKRARPIVMTTIAMCAGMLPVALGWGADPSFRSPMAIAVIGGLITSTFLSLLVIPVAFTYVDDVLNAFGRKVLRPKSA